MVGKGLFDGVSELLLSFLQPLPLPQLGAELGEEVGEEVGEGVGEGVGR